MKVSKTYFTYILIQVFDNATFYTMFKYDICYIYLYNTYNLIETMYFASKFVSHFWILLILNALKLVLANTCNIKSKVVYCNLN